MFVTNKKFLSKDLTDNFYRKFLKVWLKCDLDSRNQIKAIFNKMMMTKNFFLLLAYLYFLYRQCKVLKILALYKIQRLTWKQIVERFKQYPIHKLNQLLEIPSFVSFNDLYYYLFQQQLMLPISTHCNIPCMKLFCLRNFEQCNDITLRYAHRASNLTYQDIFHGCSLTVPCGNFIFAMAMAMIENYCYSFDRFLIPLENNNLVPIVLNKQEKHQLPKILTFALTTVLKRSLTSSIISLPVLCFCKTKCLRYAKIDSYLTVICSKCGHCLNSGKERLKGKQTFSLSSMFYYRDRQEKNIIYSMHTDLLYCSLCGGQRLTLEKVYELYEYSVSGIQVKSVSWKAIIGTNSACTILNDSVKFAAIVACSCRTCYSMIHLQNLTINKLLKLISHSTEFQCQDCQNIYRETCLDLEDCGEICTGCKISQLAKCTQHGCDTW